MIKFKIVNNLNDYIVVREVHSITGETLEHILKAFGTEDEAIKYKMDTEKYLREKFSVDMLTMIEDQIILETVLKELFGEELDPEFASILHKHSLKGKKKRTRW